MITLAESTLLAFDLETTGIDPLTAEPVSYALVHEKGFWQSNLCKPSIPISPEATAVHGITNKMTYSHPTAETAMQSCYDWFCVARGGALVVTGMNLSYDLTIFNRYHPDAIAKLAIFDILVVDRHYDKYRKGKRKLTDLARKYEVPFDNAHNAYADAAVTIKIARKQIQQYSLADWRIDDFTDEQKLMFEEWISNYNLWRLENGMDGIEPGRMFWPIQR